MKKTWMGTLEVVTYREMAACCLEGPGLKKSSEMNHMGVERILLLARKLDPNVIRGNVKKVVRRCVRYQSIDAAPIVHEAGEIQVKHA